MKSLTSEQESIVEFKLEEWTTILKLCNRSERLIDYLISDFSRTGVLSKPSLNSLKVVPQDERRPTRSRSRTEKNADYLEK